MSKLSNVRIVSDGTPMDTQVFVDDVEIKGVRRISFDLEATRQPCTVWLEVYAPEFDGTFEQWAITKPTTGHDGSDGGAA